MVSAYAGIENKGTAGRGVEDDEKVTENVMGAQRRKRRMIELQGATTVFQIYVWNYATLDLMLHFLLDAYRYETSETEHSSFKK